MWGGTRCGLLEEKPSLDEVGKGSKEAHESRSLYTVSVHERADKGEENMKIQVCSCWPEFLSADFFSSLSSAL